MPSLRKLESGTSEILIVEGWCPCKFRACYYENLQYASGNSQITQFDVDMISCHAAETSVQFWSESTIYFTVKIHLYELKFVVLDSTLFLLMLSLYRISRSTKAMSGSCALGKGVKRKGHLCDLILIGCSSKGF